MGLLLRDLLEGMGSGEDHINGSRIILKRTVLGSLHFLIFSIFQFFQKFPFSNQTEPNRQT